MTGRAEKGGVPVLSAAAAVGEGQSWGVGACGGDEYVNVDGSVDGESGSADDGSGGAGGVGRYGACGRVLISPGLALRGNRAIRRWCEAGDGVGDGAGVCAAVAGRGGHCFFRLHLLPRLSPQFPPLPHEHSGRGSAPAFLAEKQSSGWTGPGPAGLRDRSGPPKLGTGVGAAAERTGAGSPLLPRPSLPQLRSSWPPAGSWSAAAGPGSPSYCGWCGTALIGASGPVEAGVVHLWASPEWRGRPETAAAVAAGQGFCVGRAGLWDLGTFFGVRGEGGSGDGGEGGGVTGAERGSAGKRGPLGCSAPQIRESRGDACGGEDVGGSVSALRCPSLLPLFPLARSFAAAASSSTSPVGCPDQLPALLQQSLLHPRPPRRWRWRCWCG